MAAAPHRPSARFSRRAALITFGISVAAIAWLGFELGTAYYAYSDYLDSRNHLRNLAAICEQYDRVHGTYPISLHSLPPAEPTVQWALSSARFSYLGAGLNSSSNPDIYIARYRPYRDSGEHLLTMSGDVSWTPDRDIPARLAQSDALRAASTKPTTRPWLRFF